MKIKANDRVLLSGKTGSGKTWLAEHLLIPVKRLIVVDPKATLGKWNLKEPTDRDLRRFDRGGVGRYRVLPPITESAELWYEQLFERCYDTGNLTVYIDEAYAVTPPGSKPSRWLTALYTRGRERGIGVWCSTQRPTWIPLFLISEADWIISFRLNIDDDRKRIASMAGSEVLQPINHEHGFWLYHVGDDKPYYYPEAVVQSQKVEYNE